MSSDYIYRDSLRFDGRRADLTLFLAPDVSNAEVLDSPEYQAAQRLRRAKQPPRDRHSTGVTTG